jgi:hypothetical protein
MTTSQTDELHLPEWGAILTLIVLLGVTVGVVFLQNSEMEEPRNTQPHAIVDPHIYITIEGAVAHPGRVKVLKVNTLKEALDLAEPQTDADLAQLPLDKKVRKGQKVWVPSKEWIVVEVDGMGSVKLPRGTRFNQLSRFITMPEGIDRTQFKSKRLLKDREKIFLITGLGKK